MLVQVMKTGAEKNRSAAGVSCAGRVLAAERLADAHRCGGRNSERHHVSE